MFKIDSSNVITITRGDSASFTLTIQDPNTGGIFVPAVGDVVKLSAKNKMTDKTYMFSILMASNNTFTITPSMTNKQPFGSYFYDVEIKFLSGDINTIIAPDCSSGVPSPNFIVSCEVHDNG